MESYRGQLVESDRDDFDAGLAVIDPAEDDIGHESPPLSIGQDERRMQVRAYNHWASLLGDRNFPAIKDLTAGDLPEFADHAVILDFSRGIENPAITMLGEKLAAECGATKAIKRLSDVPSRSLLSRITDHYMQILANQAPIGFEAEFVNDAGRTVLYRGILLPFSSDGEAIQHIMGVINWKEAADAATTAELERDVARSLAEGDAAVTKAKPGRGKAAREPRNDEARGEEARDEPARAPDIAETPPEPLPAAPAEDWSLGDWLASARELAALARGSEDRSRAALYAAIGRAWDFALAADFDPHAFRTIVTDAGLKVQERAPMTPVVKLVFGADYDKTRLTEYAAALMHARRHAIERGALAGKLADAPGGLKGVVSEERRERRAESGQAAEAPQPDPLLERLRALPPLPMKDLGAGESEFSLALLRRMPDGKLKLIGEIGGDCGLVERAGRHILKQVVTAPEPQDAG
ncbi:MAG: hypothetical protein KGK11_08265 [Sphingomonadales bacterium]|nr:hypothetical protein [Sphingomonadales bacterium]